MTNAAYIDLRNRLTKESQHSLFESADVIILNAIVERLDMLSVASAPTPTINALGRMFIQSICDQLPPDNQSCSQGVQRLGNAGFLWAREHGDWSVAAWLMCIPALSIELSAQEHPDARMLHALTNNALPNWPDVYTDALNDDTLMAKVFAVDAEHVQEDSVNATEFWIHSLFYAAQRRHGCYLGRAQGPYAAYKAISWLAEYMNTPSNAGLCPQRVVLRHRHPEESELLRQIQNQWRVNRFWHGGDPAFLDQLSGLHANDFQCWLWIFNAKHYSDIADAQAQLARWNDWWLRHRPDIYLHASFWLDLHAQAHGLDCPSMDHSQRMLVVRDALAQVHRCGIEVLALPEGCLETPAVAA